MRPRLMRSLFLASDLLSAAILGAGCGSPGNDNADPATVMPAGSQPVPITLTQSTKVSTLP